MEKACQSISPSSSDLNFSSRVIHVLLPSSIDQILPSCLPKKKIPPSISESLSSSPSHVVLAQGRKTPHNIPELKLRRRYGFAGPWQSSKKKRRRGKGKKEEKERAQQEEVANNKAAAHFVEENRARQKVSRAEEEASIPRCKSQGM